MAKNGNADIESALSMFDEAEKKIKKGIQKNNDIMETEALKLKLEEDKLQVKKHKAMEVAFDLKATNERGAKFIEKLQSFFSED